MEISTDLIVSILVPILVGSIIIWLNPPENNRRVFGNWKNWFILIPFVYGWLFLSLLIHESGHGIVAHLFGHKVPKMEVGTDGWNIITISKLGWLEFDLIFRAIPLKGLTTHMTANYSKTSDIIITTSGVIFEYIFYLLVYWWLKKKQLAEKESKNGSLINFFLLNYLIKINFWCSLIMNCIPFIISGSDGTNFFKLLLG